MNFPSNKKYSKEELLADLRQKISSVQEGLATESEKVGLFAFKTQADILKLKKEDREHAMHLRSLSLVRYEQLKSLGKSPFFAKCTVAHKSADVRHRTPKEIYFGKYEFSERNIYSWVAPIAKVRFAAIGDATFRVPNGQIREVTISEKEQYMIVDGKILFYSKEDKDYPRELIYQEHFSLKKGAFILPEIVEVMEKAQDDIIRASYFGPFAISGPAGSGKTTLALHRVAFLAQSPETMELYPSHSIIVFVQDVGTKEYFSHLLPDLGIHNVLITTFVEWAKDILNLPNLTYLSDADSAKFELEKISIKNKIWRSDGSRIDPLKSQRIRWNETAFVTLENVYALYGSKELKESFNFQRRNNKLDRIDLTLALLLLKERTGKLELRTESNRVMRMGKIVKHVERKPVMYTLAVVDEFQNYMPEQLSLLKSCLDEQTQSIVYVGDMSQQIRHSTVREWSQFSEQVAEDRQIKLQKVYRNTKQILRFIKSLGYTVEVPAGLKEGTEVTEHLIKSKSEAADMEETLTCVKDLIQTISQSESGQETSVGILAMSRSDLKEIKEHVAERLQSGQNVYKNIKILTISEAQGVEFDVVCIVGVHRDMFSLSKEHLEKYSDMPNLGEEKKKIYRDLLYIALTRAISEMHIVGSCKLEEVTCDLL